MKTLICLTTAAFLTSVIGASAMPVAPSHNTPNDASIQIKAKKMSKKSKMKDMKGMDKEGGSSDMKGMDGMKGMKGM